MKDYSSISNSSLGSIIYEDLSEGLKNYQTDAVLAALAQTELYEGTNKLDKEMIKLNDTPFLTIH